MATLTVQAAGTTTPNNWSLAAGASKQAAVNAPDDDATSYISSGTTINTVQTFTCSPGLTTGDTITQIDINIRYRRPAAASNANFVVGYSFTKNGGGTQSGTSTDFTSTNVWQGSTYSHSSLSAAWGSGFTFYCQNTQSRDVWISTLEVTFTYTAAPQTLTGAFISSGTALYGGGLKGKNTLVGAHRASGKTLYGGALHAFNVLTGAHRASGKALYAGTLKGKSTLVGAHIAAGHVVYAGAINTTAQTLTGAHIAAGHVVYAGGLHRGAIRIANVTHYEGSGISAASFDHTTPAGNDRLLVVTAVYKDTAGLNSAVWGTYGAGDGQFTDPYGVAVASDGSVYVADQGNNRVQKFTSSGTFVAKWGSGGSGDGQFNYPTGVAVASDGSVYVADFGNHRVQKFTSSGTFVAKWGSVGGGDGQFNYPTGVAVASDGSVYVADHDNHRIQKFTSSGTFVAKWGSVGSGDGQFDYADSVAVAADGSVYVADNANSRVQKFTAGGTFVAKWGTYGAGDGQFTDPHGVAVASDGSVYVADQGNNRVQKFTSSGTFVAKWGSGGSGDGQFNYPTGVAVASDGSVYVADQGNNRVQKFEANLKLNTARYGGEEMQVGPLVDAGSYFVAFYTLENPPVGTAEIAFAAPTGPDVIMLTAISLSGVETYSTDYSGPNAGVAEQETSTTQLQVSHDRAYPTNTLSLWAALYESAGTTLTAASGNFVWLQRNVGNLRLALGWRPIPTATSGSITFGATASPAVTPRISSVLHIEGKRGNLAGAFISSGSEVFAGVMTRPGQYLQGAFIGSGRAVYGGAMVRKLAGAFIESTAELYAGEIVAIPGATQVLEGAFIGRGTPRVITGAFIEATLVVLAGELFSLARIEGAFIEAGHEVFAGAMGEPISRADGRVFAGTIAHV